MSDRYKEMWEDAFHDNLEKRDEISELKAEVELWKLRSNNWQKFCGLTRPEMTDELNRLKDEVEQLTVARNYFIRKMMQKIKDVDRLTKAGDAMADECSNFQGAWPLIKDWHAAKGVQS